MTDRVATITRLPDPAARVDLRLAPLADVAAIDFRAPTRDFWADEAALWDRFRAVWAGLDDAAWRLPGAAPSDAGGPDWSLLEHVAHVADWLELAIVYTRDAIATGRWPSDDDYDGGDFDTFNERRRPAYRQQAPAELRRRALADARPRLVGIARDTPLETIRSDAAWGWVYNVLHGHVVDHLRVLEPWADRLRARQVGSDPFGPDPQPSAVTLKADVARFWADEASVFGLFDELVRDVPQAAWTAADATPGWTLADHVGHVGAWFDEAVRALEEHRRTGGWIELPPEGVDAWNHARVPGMGGREPSDLLARFDAAHARLKAAVEAMTPDDWLDPEGFSWAYEDLHGHLRAHLAMVGPYAAHSRWLER